MIANLEGRENSMKGNARCWNLCSNLVLDMESDYEWITIGENAVRLTAVKGGVINI